VITNQFVKTTDTILLTGQTDHVQIIEDKQFVNYLPLASGL